jgi:pSer/pThr/pTyr-binding forkhead associated (FHA) protein
MAVLRVIVGPDVGLTAQVADLSVTIGRCDDCQLRLTDEHASMIHAAVEPIDDGWRVRDLESATGTAVNGSPVAEHRLMVGDIIKLGVTLILFGSGDETVTSSAAGYAEAPEPGELDGV